METNEELNLEELEKQMEMINDVIKFYRVASINYLMKITDSSFEKLKEVSNDGMNYLLEKKSEIEAKLDQCRFEEQCVSPNLVDKDWWDTDWRDADLGSIEITVQEEMAIRKAAKKKIQQMGLGDRVSESYYDRQFEQLVAFKKMCKYVEAKKNKKSETEDEVKENVQHFEQNNEDILLVSR